MKEKDVKRRKIEKKRSYRPGFISMRLSFLVSHFINPFLYTSDKAVSTFVCDDF